MMEDRVFGGNFWLLWRYAASQNLELSAGELEGLGILLAGNAAGTGSEVRAGMCRVTIGCSGSLLCYHLSAETRGDAV